MPAEIFADIGVNHGGNLRTAFDLVDAARKAGADMVKFQTWFRTDFTHVPFPPWSKDIWRDLFMYCEWRGMPWFSTPFDLEAIAFLKEEGMKVWKVPSGMITNWPYLDAIDTVTEGGKKGRILISTGMATDEERTKIDGWFVKSELLYCVSLYPAKPEDIDLNKLVHGEWVPIDCSIGFSDHSEGDELTIAAVAHSAQIIEKHLTLDRSLPGPDHKASLDPVQFSEMVRKIRNVEIALQPKPMSEREYAQRDIIRQRMAFR